MPTTANDLIRRAATAIGVTAPGEYTAWDSANKDDALERLNNMVSGWRTQFGTVNAVERNVFALTDNKQTYTIGVGGDFNVVRPMAIVGAGMLLSGLNAAVSVTVSRSGYTATVAQTAHGLEVGDESLIAGANEIEYNGLQTVQTVPDANTWTYTIDGLPVSPATGTITAASLQSQPIEVPRPVITDDAFQLIQIKTLPNSQFTVVYYNPTFPFGTVFLWPMPNTTLNQLVLYLQSAFGGFADLTTEYDYPELSGYTEALEYNLAVRLLSVYGKTRDMASDIVAQAQQSLGLIKRANNKLTDLPTDAQILTHNRRWQYNINSGVGGGS